MYNGPQIMCYVRKISEENTNFDSSHFVLLSRSPPLYITLVYFQARSFNRYIPIFFPNQLLEGQPLTGQPRGQISFCILFIYFSVFITYMFYIFVI